MSHLQTTFQHIRRSPYQALAAVGVMSLTFFVACVFFLAALGSQAILSYFEKKPQITVFFKDEKSEESIRNLEKRLKATGKVASLKFVSKEEALRIYREQNKDDPLLLEMVTAEILPASLEISATDPKYLAELAAVLEKEPLVEDVMYQQDVIEALISWTAGIRLVGTILVSFLIIVSLLIVLTVIGMKIALKKEEIEILKLVGASSWFIRTPFLLEGMFYGMVGAFLAWGVVYLLLSYLTPFLASFLTGIPLLPVPSFFMIYLLLGMIFAGALIGGFGSFLALLRYI